MKVLRKGGLAVHTTEFNLSSDNGTLDEENLCIFRKKDIKRLISELTEMGYLVSPMDWFLGNGVVDNFIDLPPYMKRDMHLRLLLEKYASTSIGIIIQKI